MNRGDFPTKWTPMPPAVEPESPKKRRLLTGGTLAILEGVNLLFNRKKEGVDKIKYTLAWIWLLMFILSGAWTSPVTLSPGNAFGATTWNTYVRDNLNYLLSGRQWVQQSFGKASDTTPANSTTFADADATNLAIINFTPNSTRVRVRFTFYAFATTAFGYFDIYNTTLATRSGDATFGLITTVSNAGPGSLMVVEGVFTGLTPGIATTFKLQYKNITTGTVTIKTNNTSSPGYLVWMYAQEM